jgi:hypothetical protein
MSTKDEPLSTAPTKAYDESISSDGAFKAAIDELERCLVTPILSGELAAWVGEAQEAWREAAGQVHFQLKHLHPNQYEEIAKQDPALFPRIDLLKLEDAAIDEQRDQINQSVVHLAQHIPKLEPDEEKAQKLTISLVDDGLAFVARVRKQVVAVQTWYIEAFNRDGGAVD